MDKEDREAGERASEAIIISVLVVCPKLFVSSGQLAQGP